MPRVVRFHEVGGPDVLRIETVDMPQPGPGEVRLRVMALGLNRAEALLRRGTYIEQPVFPSGLGLEAAGIVDAVGEGVSDLSDGDAVSIIPPVSMVRWPAYGEVAMFPAELVARHPPELAWEAAAGLWMPYLTAYGALIQTAGLREGDVVVITAASSSVGLAAIQIANMIGATPIAITRHSAKKERLLQAGAAHVIASAEEPLGARLREVAGPGSVRVVFDAVGGPAVEDLAGAMATGGILIEYGGLSPVTTPFPMASALGKVLTLRGFLVHEVVTNPDRLAAAKAFIAAGVSSGRLMPVIDRVFAFEDIVAAHRYLESNQQFGKIVVRVPFPA